MISHKLVMYGGAFNPPHLDHIGHDGVVGTLLASVAERVLIIPTGKREDKDYGDISDDHRLRLLEIATEDFGDRVEIDPILLSGQIDSTTLAQARYLREKYGYDIPQVFGSDVAPNMKKWDPSGYIARDLPKIFLSRPGFPLDDPTLGNYQEVDFASRGFSSTEVRKCVRDILLGNISTDVLKNRVQKKVLDYILDHRLFLESNP